MPTKSSSVFGFSSGMSEELEAFPSVSGKVFAVYVIRVISCVSWISWIALNVAPNTDPRITRNTRITRNVLNSTLWWFLFWRTNWKVKSEGGTDPYRRVHFNGASVRSRDSTNCGQS